MSRIITKPNKLDQKLALNTLEYLRNSEPEIVNKNNKSVSIQIGKSKGIIEIPLKAYLFLRSILSNMAEGKSIILLPTDSEISTQEAADILNVSRPHIVKLLEEGKIPYHKAGSHRRIQLKDLLSYEEDIKSNRKLILDELVKEAQDLKLGY